MPPASAEEWRACVTEKVDAPRRRSDSEGSGGSEASVGRESAARSVVSFRDNNEPNCPEYSRVVQSTAVHLNCCVGRSHHYNKQSDKR